MYNAYYNSPIGLIRIEASDRGLLAVSFLEEGDGPRPGERPANDLALAAAAQLEAYFAGNRRQFDLPLCPSGTEFQKKVWEQLVQVPFGKTDTYSGIAHRLSSPLSVRAVGAANGRNPIAIIIPCHRIIGADGSLTGYAGGLWRKEYLLKLEGRGPGVQTRLW